MGLFKDNEINKYIDLARAKSEALFNIYGFLKENIKSMNTKDKLKATKTLKTTTIDLISKKTTLHVQHTFLYISLPLFCTTETSFYFLFTRFMEEMFVFVFTLFFHCRSFSLW